MNTNLDTLMSALAAATNLQYDGQEDTRLFVELDIFVDVSDWTEKNYAEMEKDLGNYRIEGKGYKVSAWNDASGYNYWKAESEDGDHNYIQVTVYVDETKIESIDPKQVCRDVDTVQGHFDQYNTYR